MEIPVSISCGMAVYGVDTEDINKLIEYGDYAMYQAKIEEKALIIYLIWKNIRIIKQ